MNVIYSHFVSYDHLTFLYSFTSIYIFSFYNVFAFLRVSMSFQYPVYFASEGEDINAVLADVKNNDATGQLATATTGGLVESIMKLCAL